MLLYENYLKTLFRKIDMDKNVFLIFKWTRLKNNVVVENTDDTPLGLKFSEGFLFFQLFEKLLSFVKCSVKFILSIRL